MHQGLKLALIGSSLLFTAPALAQDAPAGGDATAAPANPDPNAAAGTTPTVGATAEAGATAGWSDQNIQNPQTLPKGAIGAFGNFEILKLNFSDPVTMTSVSATAEFLELGGGFGVTDKITAGFTYAFDVHDDSGTFPNSVKGPLDLYGAYNVMHKDKLSVTAGADFSIDTGNTDTKSISAGLSAKYMVSPTLAVYTGNPLPLGPAGQHLRIDLGTNGPIDFRIPVGVAIQPNPKLFAFVDTTLLNIGISNSDTNAIGSDAVGIPVDLGALYRASKDLDVGLLFADDLKHAGDFYIIGLTARFYKH
jgi:hypothetical protein